jgi:hypothetical protein
VQIPLLNGVYANEDADLRTAYPRNLVPVPKSTGISEGYLRPAQGAIESPNAGPGIGRGGTVWNGLLYRVMGTKLVGIGAAGQISILGDVGMGGQVRMDYGFDRLSIASGGNLFYWDGLKLTQVNDPDLGPVVDAMWIAGYFMTTDGTSLVVTELNDPTSVNPLKYGSSEADPDPVMAVAKLHKEAIALNRYTIEVFENVGGSLFPFSPIEGAMAARGVIGTHAWAYFLSTIAFVGSGRKKEGPEPPSVYLLVSGDTQRIATREIEQVLQTYTEAELALCVVEGIADRGHQQLRIHLPDRCLVYDAAASQIAGEPVWYSFDSGMTTPATYRIRNLIWCYDQWNCEDPTTPKLGTVSDTVSTHYGDDIGWEFSTFAIYNSGNGAIVNEMELVTLTGRVAAGTSPVVWASYTEDGETWSQEKPAQAGVRGDRAKRIVWRRLGRSQNWRVQRFRGTSEAHLSFARLETDIEPLAS